ncbi:MAG: HlyD family efflux transporter periplasmic adaptor subunit [Deltaproteobacteria bacterium]|nr:HlyD family efflux transporter periplasmic adaptor subunit [Deltaproteobacteria bacterium]
MSEKYPVFDHSLWTEFVSSRGRDEYCSAWIKLQCSLIPDFIQCVLFLSDLETGSFGPVAKWPDSGEDPERLKEITERVIEERCGLLLELSREKGADGAGPGSYGVGYPIFIDDRLQGVIALEVLADSEGRLANAMGQLQWGAGWLELFFRRRHAREGEGLLKNLKSAVDMMAQVFSETSFKGAAIAFVTQLAVMLKCDRVSLAFVKGNHSRIQAVSHSSQVGERMNLIRAIELAIDEAVVQRREILYPLPAGGGIVIVRNHEQLSKDFGAGAVFTLPFHGEGRYYGALTLERPDNMGFPDEDLAIARSVASLIFPVLETKRRNDRNLFLKTADSFSTQLNRLIGPHYAGRKLAALIIICLAVFFNFKTGDYRVSCDTTLEGRIRRSIVTPFDGYIKDAFVRAGDTVDEGTLMCTLDDRDLRLERLNLISRQNQYQKQYQESVAGHNRAESEIIRAQLEQVAAQLELVESKIERTNLAAPFRGLVLTGDLSQRLGGAVEKGEILFEIAPLDSYRIILEVHERHIADIRPGQEGHVILSSLPDEVFGFTVEKITPISIASEGVNYFRVEAAAKDISERLRPGMTGVGKVFVDRRKLIDIWTRNLRDWFRLKLWSWRP